MFKGCAYAKDITCISEGNKMCIRDRDIKEQFTVGGTFTASKQIKDFSLGLLYTSLENGAGPVAFTDAGNILGVGAPLEPVSYTHLCSI